MLTGIGCFNDFGLKVGLSGDEVVDMPVGYFGDPSPTPEIEFTANFL